MLGLYCPKSGILSDDGVEVSDNRRRFISFFETPRAKMPMRSPRKLHPADEALSFLIFEIVQFPYLPNSSMRKFHRRQIIRTSLSTKNIVMYGESKTEIGFQVEFRKIRDSRQSAAGVCMDADRHRGRRAKSWVKVFPKTRYSQIIKPIIKTPCLITAFLKARRSFFNNFFIFCKKQSHLEELPRCSNMCVNLVTGDPSSLFEV